jgi:hypothetical protein
MDVDEPGGGCGQEIEVQSKTWLIHSFSRVGAAGSAVGSVGNIERQKTTQNRRGTTLLLMIRQRRGYSIERMGKLHAGSSA